MATHDLQKELIHYFMLLNDKEKKTVLQMIKTFLQGRKEPSKPINVEQYNQELAEADPEYERGGTFTNEEVIATQNKRGKADKNELSKRISIEQYNQELDEAEARMNAGEFYTHEQVIAMSKTWVKSGK